MPGIGSQRVAPFTRTPNASVSPSSSITANQNGRAYCAHSESGTRRQAAAMPSEIRTAAAWRRKCCGSQAPSSSGAVAL
jgi:hypothetical protein